MFATGLAFLSGILIAALSPGMSDTLWIILLPLILLQLGILPPRYRSLRLLLWALAGLLYASAWNGWRLDHRLEAELNNRRVVAVGEVKSIPRLTERNPGREKAGVDQRVVDQRFEFRLHHLEDQQGRPIETDARLLRLSWRDAPLRLEPGQIWRLPLRLRQPHGYLNPGGFDYERWLWLRGIDATGYVQKNPPAQLLRTETGGLAAWRYRLVERLRRICVDCGHVGLIEALSVGYRGDLPTSQRDLLRQTGTAHLVALSGLHIGIVAFGFHWLGRLLWRLGGWRSGVSRSSMAWISAFLGGLAYALLSGPAIPAMRAVIMLGLMMLALLLGRRGRLPGVLGLTVILVLIIDPLSVLSASFWLSFGAICVIIFGLWRWPGQRNNDAHSHPLHDRMGQGLRIQALFSLLFLPVGLAVFAEIHTASLLANLLAVPLVSLLIVPFNFLLLLFSWLPLEWLQPFYRLLDGLLGGLVAYLSWLRDGGLAAQPLPAISPWLLLLLMMGLLALLMPAQMLRGRPLWLLLPLPLLWPQWNRSADVETGNFVAEVLDVGMGTSLLIRTREHSLVYDFGPGQRQGYSMGQWAVVPTMQYRGISRPDRIVLSHEDQDHVGGFLALAASWPRQVIDTGTSAETRRKFPAIESWRNCHETPPWRWDGVEFRYLSTGIDNLRSENDRSCVLRVQSAAGAVLLVPGDIEAGQERRLLESQLHMLGADALIAPHHGSESSSSEAFVEAVNPRHVIFTSGFLNRWRFPRETVLQRYRVRATKIRNTARDGALRLDCSARCRVAALRASRPRPWH